MQRSMKVEGVIQVRCCAAEGGGKETVILDNFTTERVYSYTAAPHNTYQYVAPLRNCSRNMRELFSEILTKEGGQRGAQLVAARQYTWVVEDQLVCRHVSDAATSSLLAGVWEGWG